MPEARGDKPEGKVGRPEGSGDKTEGGGDEPEGNGWKTERDKNGIKLLNKPKFQRKMRKWRDFLEN